MTTAPAAIASPPPVRAVAAPASAPGWTLRAVLKVAAIAALTLPALPVQMAVTRFAPAKAGALPRWYHRQVCRVLGVRKRIVGQPPAGREPGLIVANHVSWLDVPVIGAQAPVSFVAKSEIAGWPGIGLLARLQRTIFIDRARRAATADIAGEMGQRLNGGDRVVLFAEGTTGDGSRILPFRSSLLGAVKEAIGSADDREILVHPLAVLYVGRHGLPGGRAERARLAWYGDTELAPHLFEILNGGPLDVVLVWGEPIRMGRAHSRKEATRLAEQAIRRAAVTHLTGRDRD
jgi:1-acyl-sn-glycerol-3-phosphate acyltransferase